MDGHGALDDHPVAGYTGPPTNGPDDEHGAEPRSPVSSELSNTSIPMVLYPLPVNTLEVERYDDQHEMFKDTIGANYFGPVRELLTVDPDRRKHVVDLGCGNGLWVEQMAEEFPDVCFHGLDIVPVESESPPTNVLYEVADFTQDTRYEDASIDMVQARQIILGMSNYPALLRECGRILRPGGLFLSGEWSHFVVYDPAQHQSAERFPHMTRFMAFIGTMLERRGNDTRADYIPDHVKNSGLFDVVLDVAYTFPVGAWGADERHRGLGSEVARYTKEYIHAMKDWMLQEGWTEEDYEALQKGAAEEMDTKPYMVMVFNCLCARRKPTEHGGTDGEGDAT